MKRLMTWAVAGLLAVAGAGAFAQKGAPGASSAPAAKLAPSAPWPVAGARELSQTDVDAWLDGYMPYALRSGDIAGAVVVVVKDGKVLTQRGFGYADIAKRKPVDPERTLFRPGSVSKLFTWTAAMQLVEQGKLDLDADINRYLDFTIPARKGQPVTLRQLMTHTAGFEDTAKIIISYDAADIPTLEQYIKRYTPKRIFDAGSTPSYSNWGTALTAYIVQRVSGEEFNTYLDHHIFAPLDMRYATFRQPLPANLAPYMAEGYPEPGSKNAFELVGPAPAGSASVSGADMARFMIAHLQGGELNGQRILSAQTAQMMHDSPLDKVDPESLIPPLNRMELGFFKTDINGRNVIAHLGDVVAFHTSLHLFTKEGVGFYVSFNSPGKAGAVGALRTAMFEDFADRYFPEVAPASDRVDAKTAKQHALMMVGNWIGSRRQDSSFIAAVSWLGGQTEISVGAKGELIIPSLVNAGGRPREWVEIAPFVWRDAFGHEMLAAKVENGRVVRWSFGLVAPFMVYDPVPGHLSTAWILPALGVAVTILLLTFLQWPVAALARRTYKVARPLEGRALRLYRANRILIGMVLAVLVGWVAAIALAFSKLEMLAGGLDTVFWMLQIVGAFAFVGAVLISGYQLWLTWESGARWTRKLWGLLVFVSAALILYAAIVFRLMAMTVNY